MNAPTLVLRNQGITVLLKIQSGMGSSSLRLEREDHPTLVMCGKTPGP